MADRDVEILELVESNPDSTITTLREMVYWASKNQHVHYRVNKLEERDLVETEKDEEAVSRGPLPPVRVSPTEAGVAKVAAIDDEAAETVEERVEMLEKSVGKWGDTYAAMKRRIVELEETIEEYERELDRLGEDVERIKHWSDEDGDVVTLGGDGFEFD